MVGRAGRAGQAKLGEAFIIGRGDPEALFGDWKSISQLLVAPVPSLHSQLLAQSAFQGATVAMQLTSVQMTQSSKSGSSVLQRPGCSHAKSAGDQPMDSGQAPTLTMLGNALHDMTHVNHESQVSEQALSAEHIVAQNSQTSRASASSQRSHESCARQQHSQAGIGQALPVQSSGHVPAGQKPTSQGMAGGQSVQSASTQQGITPSNTSDESTQQLQRMLLEAIANGSIGSAQDINRLIQSTLLSHQSQYGRMNRATKTALAALRCTLELLNLVWLLHCQVLAVPSTGHVALVHDFVV